MARHIKDHAIISNDLNLIQDQGRVVDDHDPFHAVKVMIRNLGVILIGKMYAVFQRLLGLRIVSNEIGHIVEIIEGILQQHPSLLDGSAGPVLGILAQYGKDPAVEKKEYSRDKRNQKRNKVDQDFIADGEKAFIVDLHLGTPFKDRAGDCFDCNTKNRNLRVENNIFLFPYRFLAFIGKIRTETLDFRFSEK